MARHLRLFAALAALLLSPSAILGGIFECPPGSGQYQGEPCAGVAKTATVYACDNEKTASRRAAAACFDPTDERYMTVTLLSRPAGDPIGRKREDGGGLPATVKDSRNVLGSRWYLVEVEGIGEGWIADIFVRLDGEKDLPPVNSALPAGAW